MRMITEGWPNPYENLGASLKIEKEDSLVPKTKVEMWLVSPSGVVLDYIDLGENIITTQGRSNMAHLIAGDDSANRIVTSFKFGDAGHSPSDPTQALPVLAADTDLYGNEILEKLVTYTFPDGSGGNSVRFEAEIAADEGNGSGSQAYSEIGIYDVQGRMMTHRTFGLITKSAAFGILWRYRLIFDFIFFYIGVSFLLSNTSTYSKLLGGIMNGLKNFV